MSYPNLNALLNRLRRRQLVLGGSEGLLWSATAAFVLVAICVWLDLVWELSPTGRISALIAAAVAVVILFASLVWRTSRQATTESAAASLDAHTDVNGIVRSGLELENGAARLPTLTGGLAEIAVEQATQAAARIKFSQAAPAHPVARAAWATSGLLAAAVLAVALMPSLAYTTWLRFTNPFEDIPPYSHLQFRVAPGNTDVDYGGNCEINVDVEGGVANELELVYDDGDGAETLPMFPGGDGSWRAVLAQVTKPTEYHVQTEGARSRRFRLGVVTLPKIESVRVKIVQPAYANEPTYDGPLPASGVSGLAGAEVTLWAKSNRPLSGGAIYVASQEEGSSKQLVQMTPLASGDKEATGEFTIQDSGKLTLHVIDVDDQTSVDEFSANVTLLRDQRPFVRLLAPKPISLATPHANLPIAIAAEDDYGISSLQIFRSLNGSPPLPARLATPDRPSRRLQERDYLPLSSYGLSPGDEIKLFARVEDNDPAGPKGAESKVATVRIISQEEFERRLQRQRGVQVLMSKYQAAMRRVERRAAEMEDLAKKLQDADPSSPAAKAVRDQLSKLAEDLKREAAAIRESAKQALPFDLDKELAPRLEELAASLDSAAKSASNSLAAPSAKLTNEKLREQLKSLAAQMTKSQQQFRQTATEPIEHLMSVFELKRNESRFIRLVKAQRDLADRLAAAKSGDPRSPSFAAQLREWEEEQRNLRKELGEIVEDIEAQAARLPDEEKYARLRQTAEDFAQRVRQSGAADVMTQAELALAESDGERGKIHAAEAAEILESLLSYCQSPDGLAGACEGCLAFNPSLSGPMGKTLNQMLAAMGFGMGSGMNSGGQGVGANGLGGYSAFRSGGPNVGLYGGLPTQDSASGSGNSDQESLASGAFDSETFAGSQQDDDFSTAETGDAAGAGEAIVPERYRRRVGSYLRRVAEETNDQ